MILLTKHFSIQSFEDAQHGPPEANLTRGNLAGPLACELKLKNKLMRFVVIAVVPALAAASLAAQNPIPNQPNPPFFGGDKGKKDKSTTRPVHGVVQDNAGTAVAQAIVELKNVRTGKKIGTVTRQDGTYRFDELNLKDDYELQATHDQLISPVKKLSIYDSRKDPVINFELEPKKDAAPARP